MVVAWTGFVAPEQKRASGARPIREPWHPSNSPLRKYKGAIIVKEKEHFRVAGPGHAVLELRNNFHFAFGCSGGDHSLRLYVVRYGLGFILYGIGGTVFPYPRYLPSFGGIVHAHFPCIKVNIELANSVYTCEYHMQTLHWPTVESATLRPSGIYILIPRF